MIKKLISIILIVAMIVTFVGCGSEVDKNGNLKKVTIGVQTMINDQNLAKAEKYFEEEFGDVDVEYEYFDSGKDCVDAMNANMLDFACVGTSAALYGLYTGVEMQVVWVDQILDKSEGVVVKDNSGIGSLSDFKGKTIATPKNPTCEYFLQEGLEKDGVKDSEYTLENMEPNEIVDAWEKGKIDAAATWNPSLKKLVDEGGKVIYTAGQAAQNGVVTGDVTIANKNFLDAYPDFAVKYVKACDKAAKLYSNDKEKAISSLASSMKLSATDVKESIDDSIWLDGKAQLESKYIGNKEFQKKLVQYVIGFI